MEKKIQIGGGVGALNKVSMSGSVGQVPTMMVQGKPAVMVHPVTAPRHFNPSILQKFCRRFLQTDSLRVVQEVDERRVRD